MTEQSDRTPTGKTPIATSSRATLRGRPMLYTEYARDQALLNTPSKRLWTALLVITMFAMPFLPFITRSGLSDMTRLMALAIGAIGLNLVTGYAGQVSLGHAFFVGIGAFTGAALGGSPTTNVVGYELDLLIWLPAAGLVAGLVGLILAPLAARVRGLYLAILTLGLVFIGEHIFKEMVFISGGQGVGRRGPSPSILGFELYVPHEILGIQFVREAPFFYFVLILLIVMGVLARNLARSKMGRAFAAVRDRDIAAEVMGVPLLQTKVVAFGISSFYGGVCGALLAVAFGQLTPENFGGLGGLLLSVQFLAIILIGGVATISGPIIGASFVVLMPRLVQAYAGSIPFVGSGSLLSVQQLEGILFGVLIVLFLVLEPRGLFGLWLRVRNYWKAWPFSY
ncbi:MAG: branched-chain amino acid ABC transporter permease [Nitriliruptoraceae bacterium]|nr:branched-chain amino acid ABC transporter permease [Nitriliruptoraceae bacterium]